MSRTRPETHQNLIHIAKNNTTATAAITESVPPGIFDPGQTACPISDYPRYIPANDRPADRGTPHMVWLIRLTRSHNSKIQGVRKGEPSDLETTGIEDRKSVV